MIDRMSRLLNGNLARYGLRLTIVELPLRVNVEPPSSLVVLVALNVSSFAFPIVAVSFIGKRRLDRRIVAKVDLGLGLRLIVCRVLSFLLELPPLLFLTLLSCVRHGLLLGLRLLGLSFAVGSGDLDGGGFADVCAEAFSKG